MPSRRLPPRSRPGKQRPRSDRGDQRSTAAAGGLTATSKCVRASTIRRGHFRYRRRGPFRPVETHGARTCSAIGNGTVTSLPMWGIALLLGVAVSADPIRIGAALLITSRPRPVANLVAFLLGGMATGVGLAFLAVILLRDSFPVLVRDLAAGFTGGPTKLVMGVLALLIAGLNAIGLPRLRSWTRIGSSGPSPSAPQPSMPSSVSRLMVRVQHSLAGGHPWVAFVAGLGQLPVPVEYLAVLAVSAASGAAIGTQLCAAIAFTVGMFAVVEIALVAYLVKPQRTQTIMLSVHNWLRAFRRRILVVIAGASGIVLVATGVASI